MNGIEKFQPALAVVTLHRDSDATLIQGPRQDAEHIGQRQRERCEQEKFASPPTLHQRAYAALAVATIEHRSQSAILRKREPQIVNLVDQQARMRLVEQTVERGSGD